ncbi:hypothetical protein GOODEAATRI_003020 [Goodea atripinnis]|uniref:Uncharacterized protein n=1 Tax=Goodea atripinnis TaxID=208336 RepID=A0ABV0MHF8_9TELE
MTNQTGSPQLLVPSSRTPFACSVPQNFHLEISLCRNAPSNLIPVYPLDIIHFTKRSHGFITTSHHLSVLGSVSLLIPQDPPDNFFLHICLIYSRCRSLCLQSHRHSSGRISLRPGPLHLPSNRDFFLFVQVHPLNASAHEDKEEARQQAEEGSYRRQEERWTMVDAKVVRRADGDSPMEGKLLQSIQDLDPHQIHHYDGQQTQG